MRQKPSITSAQPWAAIGMSRASWYRAGKPTTKPKRYTHAEIAKITGWSIRTIQRDLAEQKRERIARIQLYMQQGLGLQDAIERVLREEKQDRARPSPR
jgi:predicted nucleotidyltransferase